MLHHMATILVCCGGHFESKMAFWYFGGHYGFKMAAIAKQRRI
jgi:hypothetical protein